MEYRRGYLRSFFFFQAEDGIRDIGVTGVQTCALPIFGDEAGQRLYPPGHRGGVAVQRRWAGHELGEGVRVVRGDLARVEARSEERRVGKECRSRGSPYH